MIQARSLAGPPPGESAPVLTDVPLAVSNADRELSAIAGPVRRRAVPLGRTGRHQDISPPGGRHEDGLIDCRAPCPHSTCGPASPANPTATHRHDQSVSPPIGPLDRASPTPSTHRPARSALRGRRGAPSRHASARRPRRPRLGTVRLLAQPRIAEPRRGATARYSSPRARPGPGTCRQRRPMGRRDQAAGVAHAPDVRGLVVPPYPELVTGETSPHRAPGATRRSYSSFNPITESVRRMPEGMP
jgi:hypothetical protein